MKGILKQVNRYWNVFYKENCKCSFSVIECKNCEKHLPVSPEENKRLRLTYYEGFEIDVEFEIVEEVIDLGRHGSTIGKYAKLIQSKKDNFKSVKEGITQSTKQSGYSVYIPENAKKQEETKVTREETTTWEDILVTISNFQSKDPHKMDLVDWLKKHYNVPTKKK